jgi:outer membrane usher protein
MFSKVFVRRKWRTFVALMIAAMISKAQAQDTEEIILRVVVNTVPKGDFIVLMTPEGDVRVKSEDFARLGIQDPGRRVEIDGEKYVSLRALEPDVTFNTDLRELKLDIQVSAGLLGETVRDLSTAAPRAPLARDASAFFNYTTRYDTTKDFGAGQLTLPTEVGVRYGDFLLLSTFSLQRNPHESEFARLNTSLLTDNPGRLQRITLGDFAAVSGPLGSSILMGGMSVAKNFAIDPYFRRFPAPDIEGIAATPSQIEIYRAGRVVQTLRVPPGKFVLQNLPGAVSGFGEYTVVVKDAFGREQRIDRRYYLAGTLLKEGIHDYSYNVGFAREEFGRESFRYGDLAFLAVHNLGLRDSINVGLSAEGSNDLVHFGPTAAVKLGTYGIVNFAMAFSRSDGKNGFGGLFAYEFLSRLFSTRLIFRAFSADYLNLSLAPASQRPKMDASLSVGLNLDRLGSLSAEASTTRMRTGQDTDRISLSYNKQLTRDLALFLSASRSWSNRASTEFFAGVNYFLGKGVSANLTHSGSDSENRQSLTVVKSAPDGEGLGFRLSGERIAPEKESDRIDGNAFVQYNGRYGSLASEYSRFLGADNYSFSLSGGVAAVGTSFHFSRPISDSFALVRVPGVAGVEVKFNNRSQGTTNVNGEFLLPNLLSFHANKVDVEPANIPLNYSIDAVSKQVTPLFRSGALVEFKLTKIQALFGSLTYLEDGQQKPVEYGQLTLSGLDKPVETPIGKEGEFYLENVPPGRYTGKVVSPGKECTVTLVVPQSDEMMIDLGSLSCAGLS